MDGIECALQDPVDAPLLPDEVLQSPNSPVPAGDMAHEADVRDIAGSASTGMDSTFTGHGKGRTNLNKQPTSHAYVNVSCEADRSETPSTAEDLRVVTAYRGFGFYQADKSKVTDALILDTYRQRMSRPDIYNPWKLKEHLRVLGVSRGNTEMLTGKLLPQLHEEPHPLLSSQPLDRLTVVVVLQETPPYWPGYEKVPCAAGCDVCDGDRWYCSDCRSSNLQILTDGRCSLCGNLRETR